MINIVLFEPEIPQNTGNIARTCVGFSMTLHLIRPYAFFLNDKKMLRASVDYWSKLKLVEHDSYEDFLKYVNERKIFFITRYGSKIPSKIEFFSKHKEDIFLMFGKESTGIPVEILEKNKVNTIRIPSSSDIRSLNLSNCVAIIAYEVLKQSDYDGLEISEPHKPIF